jgi:hypothetical protein
MTRIDDEFSVSFQDHEANGEEFHSFERPFHEISVAMEGTPAP